MWNRCFGHSQLLGAPEPVEAVCFDPLLPEDEVFDPDESDPDDLDPDESDVVVDEVADVPESPDEAAASPLVFSLVAESAVVGPDAPAFEGLLPDV